MLFRIFALSLLAASVAAKGSYMPPLSDAVMDDLVKRDPSTYETFALRNVSDSQLVERGPPNNLYGIQERCTASRCLSYTFDDGPYNNMRKIVDTAVSNGIKVTFFVNANNYDCIYSPKRVSDLKYAYSKGMQICSHTVSHPHLNSLSDSQIDEQIQGVETALFKILGVVPACIRPPYGEANQHVVDYLNNRWGYVVVNWNFDTQDADGATVKFSKSVINKIKAPKHAIILMHETVDTTANSLFPYAISKAKSNGYSTSNMYTVPAGLKFNGYKLVGQPSQRDSSWTCDNLPQPGQG
jgi:peptidoglycan/xylan/chitin deacetylase (PgdA/CDA1 family)